MYNLELNEQQYETLKMLLEVERIDENTSDKYNTIVNQILDKMEEIKI